jgi:micrococcal nuclease
MADIFISCAREDETRIRDLVRAKNVAIKEYVLDRHGRSLGVVCLDGKDINFEMVKAGLAEVYRGEPGHGLDMDAY